MARVDVIIPTYRPGKEFGELLRRLGEQSYPIESILVVNTEKQYWDAAWERQCPNLAVRHIQKKDFDHGGTRRAAAELCGGDILVFMTQDALPADRELIGNLIAPLLENAQIGAAYARQLPRRDCRYLERCTRAFNYPDVSSVKWLSDIPVYGIKTFFCSNVCAAYQSRIYREAGGFPERAIFNEDMILAGTMLQKGYGIAYQSGARVIHSHNYTARQQLHRNFDLGVSQADHPEIFAGVPSEGEGIRLVKKTLAHLKETGRMERIPELVIVSALKYIGYFLGKRYKRLPESWIRALTMNPSYWEKKAS